MDWLQEERVMRDDEICLLNQRFVKYRGNRIDGEQHGLDGR